MIQAALPGVVPGRLPRTLPVQLDRSNLFDPHKIALSVGLTDLPLPRVASRGQRYLLRKALTWSEYLDGFSRNIPQC